MDNDRRYDDQEVREILDFAAAQETASLAGDLEPKGLTLSELQEVAAEVGIDPDRITEGASALEARRGILPRRHFLGMPTGVGRVIELPRRVTIAEWNDLVVELREKFGFAGRVTAEDGSRSWTAVDMRVALEPSSGGTRVTIESRKPGASLQNATGVAAGTLGGGLLIADLLAELFGGSVFSGDPLTGPGLTVPLMFVVMAAMVLVSNRVALPRWADEREAQIDQLAREWRERFVGSD